MPSMTEKLMGGGGAEYDPRKAFFETPDLKPCISLANMKFRFKKNKTFKQKGNKIKTLVRIYITMKYSQDLEAHREIIIIQTRLMSILCLSIRLTYKV